MKKLRLWGFIFFGSWFQNYILKRTSSHKVFLQLNGFIKKAVSRELLDGLDKIFGGQADLPGGRGCESRHLADDVSLNQLAVGQHALTQSEKKRK